MLSEKKAFELMADLGHSVFDFAGTLAISAAGNPNAIVVQGIASSEEFRAIVHEYILNGYSFDLC